MEENLNEISAFDGEALRTDGPAFKDDPKEEETPTEDETKEQNPSSSGESNNEDETRVPYSRFSKVLSTKKELEEENARLKAELEQASQKSSTVDGDSSLPAWWVKMYGNDEASVEAYQNGWLQMTEEAKKLAVQELKQEQQRIAEATQRNEQIILDNIASIEESVKRQLTEDEKKGLLMTVDEFTPKNADGVYTADLFPFDKAWEIYTLKQKAQGQEKKQVKTEQKRIAGLSSQSNEDTPDGSSNAAETIGWSSWRDAL